MRAIDELANALRGQVAGGGRGRALAEKDAQPQAARAGLLQRLHLAHAHVHAELVALARNGFSVGGAGFHGQRHHVGSQRFQVESSFGGGSQQFAPWVNSNKMGRDQAWAANVAGFIFLRGSRCPA